MKESTIKISQNAQGLAKGVHDALEELAGEPMGFLMLVFTEGRATYLSNVDRKVSVREMKHLLDLWEKGMPDIPAHEVCQ